MKKKKIGSPRKQKVKEFTGEEREKMIKKLEHLIKIQNKHEIQKHTDPTELTLRDREKNDN